MLMRNVNKKNKLCNGTRLIVDNMSGCLLYCTHPITNDKIILPRFDLESDVERAGILWRRRQFPVMPAFAITSNKSQGQSISGKVGIYLWQDCFAHGQLYVAASRVTHPDRVKCFMKDNRIGTKNIVIKQVI